MPDLSKSLNCSLTMELNLSRTYRHKPHWALSANLVKTWLWLGNLNLPLPGEDPRDRWERGYDKHKKASRVAISAVVVSGCVKRGWKEYQGRWAKTHGNRQIRRQHARELLAQTMLEALPEVL